MRILLLTLYFTPDIGANAVVMTELAEALAELGHDVRVVTAFPHYARNQIEPEFRGRLFQRAGHKGIRVTRSYLYVSSDKQRVLARLFSYLSFNVLSVVAGLSAGRCDVILAPSPPLTIGLSAWAISRLTRAPFIYNVQDIYPDVAIRLGVLTNPRLIRLFQRLERFVYRKAKAVSVLSEGFRSNLLAKGVPPEKLHVIPNFIGVDFVRPLPKDNSFSRKHGLGDRFVAMYAGNVGLSQGLETLLDAARLLADLPELCILIVGNGAAKPGLEERARELGLSNTCFLPFQPREDVPEMYAAADVGLVVLKHGIATDSVPSKAYTILASGRPIVAAVDRECETQRLLEGAACGVAVPPEDPQALANALRRLYHDRSAGQAMGDSGRRHVEEHCTPQAIARQYDALFRSVGRVSPMGVQGRRRPEDAERETQRH